MSPLKLFRIVAMLEACSWAGLVVSIYLKHVTRTTDLGVHVMGPIHGVAFIAYMVVTLLISQEAGWSTRQRALGLISGVPPLMTVWFDRWAEKHRLIPLAWTGTDRA